MKLMFFQYELSDFLTPFTKINVHIKGSAELRIVKDAILLNYGYTLFKWSNDEVPTLKDRYLPSPPDQSFSVFFELTKKMKGTKSTKIVNVEGKNWNLPNL